MTTAERVAAILRERIKELEEERRKLEAALRSLGASRRGRKRGGS